MSPHGGICNVIVLMAILGCEPAAKQPSPAILAEARRELEARGRADQAVREGFGVGGSVDTIQARAMMHTDSMNTAWLKNYVARWGWPTSAQVGREAVEAAFLIVQHAVQDTAFMRSMLPAIEEAYRRGDLEGAAVAMLTDRVAVKTGHPQIYGTQLSLREGRWVLDSIADSAHVDERRRQMGLPPLAEYLRLVDSLTTGH
ncbi:MAG TPA: DUF6624 domain-containing protein [Candidatus Krumholzibacteria bacterium]|nr:DUF6624 domain-containing protein [Candidatus Krumholzibacteria bacterium]